MKDKNKKKEKKMDLYKLFLQENSNKNVKINTNLYREFQTWHCSNYGKRSPERLSNFRTIMMELIQK